MKKALLGILCVSLLCFALLSCYLQGYQKGRIDGQLETLIKVTKETR